MKKLSFYKEDSGSWYVDLPDWTGPKGELLMVAGADTLLDILSGKCDRVEVDVGLEPFEGANLLDLQRQGDTEGGGHYVGSPGTELEFAL